MPDQTQGSEHLPERQLSALIDANKDGIMVLNATGTILFANPAARQLLQRDDLVGQLFGSSLIPDHKTEVQVVQADGTMRHIEVNSAAIAWNGESATAASLRDISEYRRVQQPQQDLQGQSSVLIAAYTGMSSGVVITNATQPDNPIIYANPAFESLTGYSSAELIGRNYRFLQGAGTDAEEARRLREALEKQQPYRGRLLNFRKDGSPFWNETVISPIVDSSGKLTNFVALHTDVSEKVAAEAQLHLQAYVMDNIHDAILIIDASYTITYCNNALLNLIDVDRQRVVGRNAVEFYEEVVHLSPDELASIAAELTKRGHWMGEDAYIINGEERIIQMTLTVLGQYGEPSALVVAMLHDTTEQRRSERELRRQYEVFEKLFEDSPIMLAFLNNDGSIRRVNRYWERTIGYTEAEAQSLANPMEVFYPDVEERQRVIDTVGEESKAWHEFHPLTRDGRKLDTLWANVNLSDGTSIGIGQDVTELKRAEAKFRALLESAPDAMVIVNEQGEIELVNSQSERLFGYYREEMLGKPIEMLIPSPFQDRHSAQQEKYKRDLRVREMGVGRDLYALRKDGSQFLVEVSLSPIKTDEGILIASAIRDSSERRHLEAELREQKELLQTIFDNIPVMVALYDPQGQHLMVNRHWEELYGWTLEEVQSHPDFMAEVLPDVTERDQVINRIKATARGWRDSTIRVRSGQLIETTWANKVLPDGRFIAIGQDISERKQMESELLAQKTLLQTIVDNIPVLINYVDEAGKSRLINQHFEKVTGWSAQDIAADPNYLRDFYPTEEMWQAAQKSMTDARGEWHEYIARMRDGRLREMQWVDIRLADGSRIGLGQDITERKGMESELRAQTALLQSIVDNAPVMISYTDAEGNSRLINRFFEQVTGWSAREIKNDPDYMRKFYPKPEDYERVLRAIEEATGEWQDFKSRLRDGSYRDMQWTTIKLPDGSRLGLGQDISERKRMEDELREKTELLQSIFDNIPMMISVFDRDMRLQLINHHYAEVLGWSLEEAIAHPNLMAEMYPDEHDRRFTEDFINKGEVVWYDFKTRTKDGQFVDTRWANVTLSGGQHIGIGQDVTVLKKVEEQLRYQAFVLDNVSDAVISTDMQMNIKSWNASAERIYGWLESEVLGQSLSLLQTEVSAEEHLRALAAVTQIGHWDGEVVQHHRNGSPIYIQNTATLLRDESGAPIGMVAVNRDITRIKRTEEALRETEIFNKSILDSMTDGLTINSIDGTRLNINPAMEKMTGYSRSEIVGLKAPFPYWPNDQFEQIGITHAALMRGEYGEYELVFQRKNGERFPVAVITSGVTDAQGQLLFSFSIVRDITARKAMESALREQREVAETLRDTALLVARSLDANEVLNAICVYVGRVIRNDVASLLILRDSQLIVERSAATVHTKLANEMLGRRYAVEWFPGLEDAAQRRTTLVVENVERNPAWRLVRQIAPEFEWVRSVMFAPITVDDRVIGFLNVGSLTTNFYHYTHAHVLQLFADQAAMALKNARLYEDMSINQEQMKRLSHQVLAAQEEERRRLSRELHDEAGQALTALKIQVELIRATLEERDSKVSAQLADVATLVDQTTEQIRDLSHQLRPPTLDTVSLSKALEGYCKEFARRTGMNVTYSGVELPDASEAVKIALYRILQEALTNVTKHAAARNVWIKLESDAETIEFAIRDDGHGFSRPKPASNSQLINSQPIGSRGVGLLGMRERVELLGGRFTIDTNPGKGVSVVVTLPLEELP
ncbi:MAG: PAS domain S-box protein [Anaerolineae bacterium]|nr:PAS domain S-box protein [Anaerolineae bacterium]